MQIIGLVVCAFCLASCGTFVHVVDEADRPVEGALVFPVWPSFTGGQTMTDSAGYARLATGSALTGAPRWVVVTHGGLAWQFDYPPPSVIRLERANATPSSRRPANKTQQPTGAPSGAGG